MTDLSSLLIKNIDLILEAYNVDASGNLIVANKKKVQEADEVFHQYFVKSMNTMFRQLNEADPIMQQPNSMGLPPHGIDNLGMAGGDMTGDMNMAGMVPGNEGEEDPMGLGEPTGHHPMNPMHQQMDPMRQDMHDDMSPDMGGGSMGGMPGGGMGGGAMGMGESADYSWLNEDPDMDIDALFDLKEDQLDEFMGHHDDDDEMMGGSMDQMGGANSYGGGDMGGMGNSGGMDLGSGMDDDGGGMMGGHGDMMGGGGMGGHGDMMGGGGMGDEGDMVTIHATTDDGADIEFSFDPEDLGFGGDDMGGNDMGGGGDFGGHEEHNDFGGGDEHESHEGGEDHDSGGEHEEHGFGSSHGEEEEDEPVAEAAKKGGRGRKMAIVPKNPKVANASAFPTSMGQKQKRK